MLLSCIRLLFACTVLLQEKTWGCQPRICKLEFASSTYREYNLNMDVLEQQLELAPISTLNVAPGQQRHPEVRHQMSGPAMRTFFNIADRWSLTTEEQRAMLGWPA